MISQTVVNKAFLCNISTKPLCKKHHNKKKHLLLLYHKKFILHKYHILFQLINIRNTSFDHVECFSNTKRYIMLHITSIITANSSLTTCFAIVYSIMSVSDFALPIYDFVTYFSFVVIIFFDVQPSSQHQKSCY